jgi:hypothetical protein
VLNAPLCNLLAIKSGVIGHYSPTSAPIDDRTLDIAPPSGRLRRLYRLAHDSPHRRAKAGQSKI